ncbi:MAG TPA: hypothetical protein VF981_15305 [Gemmatimonadaceae bacterium]
MSDRRYSDEEVAAIFERAAETQHAPRAVIPRREGLTLADMQEIGRDVGISPDLVARAARSIDREPAAKRTLAGMPVGVGRTVQLARRISDEEWERLVVDLRETFDARGVVRNEGRFRSWTNGNLQALVEPGPSGDRLRLETRKGNAFGLLAGGLVSLGGAAAVLLTSVVSGDVAGASRPATLLALIGTGLIAWVAVRLPGWARLRRQQMDAVAERLERSAADVVS